MRSLLYMLTFTLATCPLNFVSAEDVSTKYLSSVQIPLIKDKHERARAWATCVAAYQTAAMFSSKLREKPAEAKRLRQLSNGARVAVAMTFVGEMFRENNVKNIDRNRFNATWSLAKLAMTEIPSTVRAGIDANLERASKTEGGLNAEMTAVYGTVAICMKNGEAQQSLIDFWRELASSGLLNLSEK